MVTFWCDLDRGPARSFRSPWLLVIKPAADPVLGLMLTPPNANREDGFLEMFVGI